MTFLELTVIILHMSIQNLEQYTKKVEEFKTETELSAWFLDLGRRTVQPESIREHKNFVNGCQSQTWMTAHCTNGVWQFQFDSDSYFVLALGRIVTDTFSGMTSEEIQRIAFHDFKSLAAHLNIHQVRGLQAFINRVHTLTTGAIQ